GVGGATAELVNGQWTFPQLMPAPPNRELASSAYDEDAHQLVTFGGHNQSGTLADTWTYDASGWSSPSGPAPPPRQPAPMAYDAAHHTSVLFGGLGGSGIGSDLDDTWLWSNGAWSPLQTPTSPPARHGHVLAYDRAHGHIVLFGGQRIADTWVLDLDQGTWK